MERYFTIHHFKIKSIYTWTLECINNNNILCGYEPGGQDIGQERGRRPDPWLFRARTISWHIDR